MVCEVGEYEAERVEVGLEKSAESGEDFGVVGEGGLGEEGDVLLGFGEGGEEVLYIGLDVHELLHQRD